MSTSLDVQVAVEELNAAKLAESEAQSAAAAKYAEAEALIAAEKAAVEAANLAYGIALDPALIQVDFQSYATAVSLAQSARIEKLNALLVAIAEYDGQ